MLSIGSFLASHILFFVGSSSHEGIAEHEKLMENSLQKLQHGSLRNSLENVARSLSRSEDKHTHDLLPHFKLIKSDDEL